MTTRVVHTPWITAVHPISFDKYTFRLSQHRRRGATHLEFRSDSATAPNTRLIIPRSRRGYEEFSRAATSLIDTACFDPKVNPDGAKPRFIWREHAPGYPLRTLNAETITLLLPRLLHPTSGRPLRSEVEAARAAAKAQGGTNVSHLAARFKRRAEMLQGVNTILAVLEPVRDRLQDARKMKGYSAEEVQMLLGLSDTIHNAASTWHRKLREGHRIEREPDQRLTTTDPSDPHLPTSGPRQLRRQVNVRVDFDSDELPASNASSERKPHFIRPDDSLDAQGSPLSPAEQQIAAEQQRQEPPAHHAHPPQFNAQGVFIPDEFWDAQGRYIGPESEIPIGAK